MGLEKLLLEIGYWLPFSFLKAEISVFVAVRNFGQIVPKIAFLHVIRASAAKYFFPHKTIEVEK